MVHPQETIAILGDLKQLGFDDSAFRELHHRFREQRGTTTKWGETIAKFEGYCAGYSTRLPPSTFEEGGNNECVHERLKFVLKTYREWKLPPAQRDVFIALAKAAWLGIRPSHG